MAERRGLSTVRRILEFARPERPLLGLASVFLVISSATGLAFPQVIRSILDGAVVQHDRAAIDRAALVMAGVLLVHGITTALRYILFNFAGERAVARLRQRLYGSLLRQEVAFFDQRRTGELTSRLSSDATIIQGTLSSNLSVGLQSAASVAGGVVMVIYTSPRLAALMLAVVPPITIAALVYGRVLRRLSRHVQDALAESNRVAEETLSGIRTVRSFAAEERELGRYARAVLSALAMALKRVVAAGSWMGATAAGGYGAVVLVLWYGGRMVIDGELTVGALASFLVYTVMISGALGTLSEKWAELMRASGAAEVLFGLIDREPLIPSAGGRVLPSPEGRVELRGVTFAYPARPAAPVLAGIDLSMHPGQVVALVGRSGAGKSTLAALLSRLYDPASGEILFDGVPLTGLDPAWLRRQVGVVSQEPLLFSCSIAENIGYSRESASREEIEAAARLANAHDFVSRFPDGYDTLVGERGVQLSGGQRQRVAIARALLKDPRVLILDEATSALDAESEALVQQALERLMKGRATLVIAHRLSTIKTADRVLVLEDGKLVQSGSHANLLKEDGLYRRLVERQFMSA